MSQHDQQPNQRAILGQYGLADGSDHKAVITSPSKGRAIAQAVSRWLPTSEARVRAQVR
jgi:hypothetical protein